MSKRPRAAGGAGPCAKVEAVEVIELLDDSSQSEDDPDDTFVQARQATAGPDRPTKRLRRMDASAAPTQNPRNRTGNVATGSAQAASATALPASRRRLAADVRLQQAQQQQLSAASQLPSGKLRQATLPVALQRPRSALPLQMLNISRPRPGGEAGPTASGDSGFGGGGGGASPAPSASPASHRSRLSQDPDYMPASQSMSQSMSQSQQRRPQVRQLTFAPARTTGSVGGGGSGCGGAPSGARGPTLATTHTAAGTSRVVAADAVGGSAGAAAAILQDSARAAAGLGTAAGGGTAATRPATVLASSASQSPTLAAEMWYERHAPRSEDDLAQVLHRKKVSEVKEWLECQRGLLLAQQAPPASGRQQQRLQQPGFPMQQHGAGQSQHQSQGWAGGVGGGPAPGFWRPRPRPCGLAVLSGPPGCGKSACLRVLAEATGFEVVEWTAPQPMMWNEYQYQRSAGGDAYRAGESLQFQSKLDEFEAFVSRSKYPSLALAAAPAAPAEPSRTGAAAASRPGRGRDTSPEDRTAAGGSGPCWGDAAAARPKLLLVEDLPHTHDSERRQRLAGALRELAACARGPVVLVVTEAEGLPGASRGGRSGGGGGPDDGGAMGGAKGLHKDILAVLQAAGSTVISFNSVTTNNIAKLLLRVAAAEGLELAPAAAVGLAEAADGDLRSALQALQMNAMLQKAALRGAAAAGAGGGRGAGGKAGRKAAGGRGSAKAGASATALLRAGKQQALTAGEVARLAAAQRDLGLPLFHALGKFLHNKRNDPVGQGSGVDRGGSDGDDDDVGVGGGGGGRGGGGRWGGAVGRGRGTGAMAGGGASKDSVALQQLNAHSLAAGRQWKLQHQVQLPARLLRPPMRYDPEAILLRCGLEAPVLLSFLHENYLGFVDGEAEDSVDDVATVAAYLSDSAVLCGHSRAASATAATSTGGTSLWLEDSPAAANLSSAISASVAARGLMYGNTHPAPHRFNPIRAPAANAIDQASAANRIQLHAAKCRLASAGSTADGGATAAVSALFSGGSASQLVCWVIPWLRSLAQTSPSHAMWLAPLLPGSWSYYWNGSVMEGAFLHRVAQLPPPGGGGGAGGAGGGNWAGGGGPVEGMMEQLGLEDEDPIEG